MKKIFRGTVVAAIALVVLSSAAVPALAASPSATDLTSAGQMIRPGRDLTVFGIDLSGSSLTTVSKVRVGFAQVGVDSDFETGDLEASPDGIQLWRDDSNATPMTQDIVDAGDTKLSGTYTFSGLEATLNISPAWHLPAAHASEGSYTLLMTIRMASSVADGDDFTATLPSNAWVTNIPMFGFAAVISHEITADPVAPTVQWFAPPPAQTDNIYWQLSEGVSGVGSSTVAFKLHGTTTDVPATVSYDSVAHRITLHPTSPLTAGQYYDANLLPTGPGGIVDRAGNELGPDPHTFRATTHVSEDAYGTVYTWRAASNSSTYNGSYTVNNIAGATAAYIFSGTSVVWYTFTDPYQGNASVSIDGVAKPTVNNYSATAKFRVARSYSGLRSGKHTITIRVLGSRGSSAGKDTRVSIDAFKDGGTLKASPNVAYQWPHVGTSKAFGGAYRSARFSGTYMTFNFRGTRIDFETALGPNMGRAMIYIDGVYKGLFENYSGVTIYKYVRSFGGLSDAVHTIKIMVASTRRTGATDSMIVVDGFDLG